jgi:hypothetical protein
VGPGKILNEYENISNSARDSGLGASVPRKVTVRVHRLLVLVSNPSMTDGCGRMVLHLAASGSIDMFEILLKAGYDPEARDCCGNTDLAYFNDCGNICKYPNV